jgi:transcriptional regulator with XRE-family HTH domain
MRLHLAGWARVPENSARTGSADDAGGLGSRLDASRQRARLSQEELTERSELSLRTLTNLERGRIRWAHPASVRRLANALGPSGEERVSSSPQQGGGFPMPRTLL